MTAPADRALGDERIACEHAERCGGCPLIGLPYAGQLAQKLGHVVQSAARYPSLELVHTEPVAPAQPIVGYRTRAKLIVAPAGALGLFAKGGGHQVVDIPHCRVLAPSLARVAAALRTRIAAARLAGEALAPFDPSGRGCLRAIDLREVLDGATARVLVTFVAQRDRVGSLEPLRGAACELMQAEPDVVGVACNLHDGDAPQVLGTETVPLAGAASATDRVGASVHLATYGSFVQAHRGQASRVHALLADVVGLSGAGRRAPSTRRVLDLYGGSGSMALALAAAGASVRLVESFAPAVAQARAAAQRSGLDVETQCADVAAALRTLAEQGERFDAVVVNPPRRGMSPTAREWLARLEPPVIAYVSCNPETLARDLDHLARLGYSPGALRPIDMIPLTDEVETVAVLKRARAALPRVLYADRDVIVVDKAAHEPTVPQGEYHSSLFARVRRIAGAENAVPVHRLDVGTSGIVVFAHRAEHVAKWERALSAASTRMIYLGAARGVTPSKGTVHRESPDGKKAPATRTRYRRLAVAAGHSILRIVPEGGRTQAIRRHLAAIGHPLLGDDRYGHAMTNRFFEEKNGLDRPFLHGSRLELDHPDSGVRHVVESPLPGDLLAVLERMGDAGTMRLLDEKKALGDRGTPAPNGDRR
ncbi:MAG TPA: pseudouridine synthase [Polyangiaceae bacterium]|nr:pseudouridine synthase [Polyangiaceae bacterium]